MELFKNLEKFSSSIALIDTNKIKVTYKDILINANILKKKLKEKSLILIVAENSLGSILSYVYSIINNYILILVIKIF